MNIDAWLKQYTQPWTDHDIEGVLSLFAQDVKYWETPHRQLSNFDELRKEWQVITKQHTIRISTELYSSQENKHSVTWGLGYEDQESTTQTWAGTYLITLNDAGLCTYFYHCGEKSENISR